MFRLSRLSIAVLVVEVALLFQLGLLDLWSHSTAKLPSVLFCPNYIPLDLGFVTDRPNSSFPLTTRGPNEVHTTQQEKELVKVVKLNGELIQVTQPVNRYPGRRAGMPIEAYMYSWFPADTVQAIIVEPKVIILGDGSDDTPASDASEKDLVVSHVLTPRERSLVVPNVKGIGKLENNQIMKPMKKEQGKRKSNGDSKKDKPTGFSRILSVQCLHVRSDGKTEHSWPIASEKESAAYYHPQIGTVLLWKNGCHVVDPYHSVPARPDDYIVCDIELTGDGNGVRALAFATGKYSYQDLKRFTHLPENNWIDLLVKNVINVDSCIKMFTKNAYNFIASTVFGLSVDESSNESTAWSQYVVDRLEAVPQLSQQSIGKRMSVTFRMNTDGTILQFGTKAAAILCIVATLFL